MSYLLVKGPFCSSYLSLLKTLMEDIEEERIDDPSFQNMSLFPKGKNRNQRLLVFKRQSLSIAIAFKRLQQL